MLHRRETRRARVMSVGVMAGLAVTLAALAAVTANCSAHPEATSATSTAPDETATSADPGASVTPGIAAMTKSRPVRLQIPAIGVNSVLMDLGLDDDGALEVPPNGFPAGWFTGAPTPGELGPAIIAGHVHWTDGPGVFWDLADLEPDDQVVVSREDGSTAVFRVTRVAQFAKAAFPSQVVYGDIDHPGLRLITCADPDAVSGGYDANLVVFADLVATRA